MLDNMQFELTPRRTSKIELEKQVFGNAISVNRTYSNKRRNTFGTWKGLTKENLSFHKFKGDSYSPRTHMDQQEKSTHKVGKWLEDCSRAPFIDLDPNVGNSEKMNLRSSSRFSGIENQFSLYSGRKSPKSPLKKSQEKKSLGNIKKKKYKAKQIDEKKCKVVQEVIDIQDVESVQSSNPIITEDSQETYIDKDHLAYQEVVKEDAREQVRNLGSGDDIEFDPDSPDVINCLKRNLDSLKLEISQLEEQNRLKRAHASRSQNQTKIWTTTSLLNVLNSDSKKVKQFLKKQNIQLSKIKKVLHAKRIPKKKILSKRKMTFRFINNPKKLFKDKHVIYVVKYYKPKPKHSVSVQTDIPFVCNKKTESIISVAGISEHKENKEANITEREFLEDVSRSCGRFIASTPEIQEKNAAKKNYSDELSVHNVSGKHEINVQVHASMDSQDSDSSSVLILSNSEKTVSPEPAICNVIPLPEGETSSPSFWEELHRTPPRTSQHRTSGVSPTYTLTPPSNSSSNKENYAPNRTPSPDTKINKKSKAQQSKEVVARRPLTSLFEAPHTTVYVCCSGLRDVELRSVEYLCGRLNWVYCQDYSSAVTHLVVKANENMARRDNKYYCAVAAGCYIVSYQWIEQSICADSHLTEEEFEVLDCSGEPGPLRSRLAEHKLFAGITFTCLSTVPVHVLSLCLYAAGARLVTPTQLEGTALVGPVVVLHGPADNGETYKDAVSKWKVAKVILHYEWALECIGRYRCVHPETFIVYPQYSTPQVVTWLYTLCDDRNGEA